MDRLRFLVRDNVESLPDAALRVALSPPAVSTVVTGMMRREEVDQNAKASSAPLPAEDVERVRALYRTDFA